ncbi:MAG TPA: B12-binding domain-containing protein [Pyrinomonadaceae bacterium]|nr:B12-binding domain-containing protein [Pyrinomonadaceae bacterium]
MKNFAAGKKLTSKEAARLLGASEASVKRWADGGLLPSEKTAGGHRRFRPEDVALFLREKARGATATRRGGANFSAATPSPEANDAPLPLTVESDEALVETLFGALASGDAEETSALLVKSYLQGKPPASICDELLAAAMRRIGDLWHRGELTIADEHLATRAALDALQTLDKVVAEPEPYNLLAVCCGTEDDFHELPVRCAELILKHAGWEVLSLGAHTPFYALTDMVARLHPALVCVASTILGDLDRAVREYGELRRTAARVGARVVLGGTGFADADIRRRLPAELHADTFQQLLDFADTLATTKRTE